MPIYEYRCRTCSHEFETIQRVGDRPLRKCPECSGRLEKLVSRASFQLKGGGWFAHGYSDKAGAKTEDKASTKKDDAASTPAKSESKPKPSTD